jgi:hypothetical protein
MIGAYFSCRYTSNPTAAFHQRTADFVEHHDADGCCAFGADSGFWQTRLTGEETNNTERSRLPTMGTAILAVSAPDPRKNNSPAA